MPWNADKTIYTVHSGTSATGKPIAGGSWTAAEWAALPAAEKQRQDPYGGWADESGNTQASSNPFSVEGGDDQLGNYFGGLGNSFGFVPKQADQFTPGASLDTSGADAERHRLGLLLGQLQQQAATGGGAWEQAFKDATQKASASAMALGQSQPGVDYASALRNIGNAQSAVKARAVGQENILRAQSKQAASDQISGLLGGMREQDINQADAAAKATQGRRQLNSTLANASNQNLAGTLKSVADVAFSDGGTVPGKPKVFGNDSRNDTVPARLTPGEIVIPLSHSSSPEAAADFVRALQRNRPPQRMAGGGQAGDPQGGGDPFRDPGGMRLGAVGQDFMAPSQAPSIDNGGLLNTEQFRGGRAANSANEDLLSSFALGRGPSVVPQQMQNDLDSNLGAAMQAGASGRGMPAGDVLQATSAANQGAAGDAAGMAATEQRAGQAGLARSATNARGAELGMSAAEQQAAWLNTQLNAGLGLAQQAQLRQIVGGLGQAGTAFLASDDGDGKGFDFSGSDKNTPDFDKGFGSGGDSKGSDPSEWENPFYAGGRVKYATGGKVTDTRGADFVRALRRSGQ